MMNIFKEEILEQASNLEIKDSNEFSFRLFGHLFVYQKRLSNWQVRIEVWVDDKLYWSFDPDVETIDEAARFWNKAMDVEYRVGEVARNDLFTRVNKFLEEM